MLLERFVTVSLETSLQRGHRDREGEGKRGEKDKKIEREIGTRGRYKEGENMRVRRKEHLNKVPA